LKVIVIHSDLGTSFYQSEGYKLFARISQFLP
jgi:hypothetical protein